MRLLNAVCRKLCFLALVLGSWLTVEATVWARQATTEPTKPDNSGGWVFPYFTVILAIGLGMLVVCRTSRRSDRARPQQFESLKTKD